MRSSAPSMFSFISQPPQGEDSRRSYPVLSLTSLGAFVWSKLLMRLSILIENSPHVLSCRFTHSFLSSVGHLLHYQDTFCSHRLKYLFIYLFNECYLVAEMVKSLPVMQKTRLYPRVGKIPCRRAGQSTLVFLPREPHGQRSMVGYSPRGRKEWTEQLHFHFLYNNGSMVGSLTRLGCVHSLHSLNLISSGLLILMSFSVPDTF